MPRSASKHVGAGAALPPKCYQEINPPPYAFAGVDPCSCVLARGHAERSLALLAVALLLLVLNLASAGPALAQAERNAAPDARTADDEFSRQLSELKKTFTDLSKRIDDSAQTMGRTQNAEAARKEIEELRAHVGALLGAVADNGTVWNLGAKALRRAEDKLKALEQETRYKPEDKQFLIERWRELKAATEGAIGELEKRAQGLRRAVAHAADQ